MNKEYFVQIRTSDGELFNCIKTEKEIIERIDMIDCSGEQIKIYQVDKFGKIEPLKILGCWHNPKNPLLIEIVDDKEENVIFSGYGTDH